MSTNINTSNKNVENSINQFYFIYKDKSKVHIKYCNDEIRIFNGKQINIKIQYSSALKNVLPYEALIVNNNLKSRNYYIYKNNILFLPVSEVNNRFNLIIVNLDNGLLYKINKNDYLLKTSAPWFFIVENKGEIVTMNTPNIEGSTLIHYFKISENKIIRDRSKSVFLNEELINNEEKLKLFLVKKINN